MNSHIWMDFLNNTTLQNNLLYLINLSIHICFDLAISILDIQLRDTYKNVHSNTVILKTNKILKPENNPDNTYQEYNKLNNVS